ncbi:helix-turn-helix transcriptional regulator [Mycolicibacterium houstonense]|uniref:helix-turn-helix transcriptional regulator n=1 Tax=Mycolicibacterium houstonense TaxID=146021 RepID=UPI000A7420E4|nr:AraC family transcriptional regulator [Mycolicibacterium houstonense]
MTARSYEGGVSPRNVTVLGIDVEVVDQQFAESVDWSFSGAGHKMLVWRSGYAGSKEVEFGNGRGGRIAPRVSDVWVVPAEQRSAASATKTQCSFVQLTFPTRVIGRNTLRPAVGEQDPLVRNMVERILSLDGRGDMAARLLQETLADGLRLHVLDRYGVAAAPNPSRTGRELSRVEQQRLVDFIRDGLSSEVDLPTLAGLVEMKLDTFRHAFGKAFHMTPYQFVLEQRIAEAKLLLASAPMSITEIGALVGFSTPSHFSTTFKQRVGVTPTAYRRAMWAGRAEA